MDNLHMPVYVSTFRIVDSCDVSAMVPSHRHICITTYQKRRINQQEIRSTAGMSTRRKVTGPRRDGQPSRQTRDRDVPCFFQTQAHWWFPNSPSLCPSSYVAPYLTYLLTKSCELVLGRFKVIQGHRSWYQSIACGRFPIRLPLTPSWYLLPFS